MKWKLMKFSRKERQEPSTRKGEKKEEVHQGEEATEEETDRDQTQLLLSHLEDLPATQVSPTSCRFQLQILQPPGTSTSNGTWSNSRLKEQEVLDKTKTILLHLLHLPEQARDFPHHVPQSTRQSQEASPWKTSPSMRGEK